MVYKAIGKRMRNKRREMNLTQNAVAEKAFITPGFYGHIERGNRKASLETIITISKALDVTPNYLLIGSDINTDRSACLQDILIREVANTIRLFLAEHDLQRTPKRE